jgi:hypothetical protein
VSSSKPPTPEPPPMVCARCERTGVDASAAQVPSRGWVKL